MVVNLRHPSAIAQTLEVLVLKRVAIDLRPFIDGAIVGHPNIEAERD